MSAEHWNYYIKNNSNCVSKQNIVTFEPIQKQNFKLLGFQNLSQSTIKNTEYRASICSDLSLVAQIEKRKNFVGFHFPKIWQTFYFWRVIIYLPNRFLHCKSDFIIQINFRIKPNITENLSQAINVQFRKCIFCF